ncbi:MAG TPA: PEP-CTERM sorting domain-containing protein [Chthoniobacteraceae bacterium]|nr:PEP-CTERM sorting domain-containing protein [Chthoniobacteraceae bacterium]
MKKATFLHTGAFLLFAFATDGSGAVLVDYTKELPVEPIAISNPVTLPTNSLSTRWTPANGRRDMGQMFRSDEDFSLHQIILYAPGASPTTVERPFTVYIEDYTGTSVSTFKSVVSQQGGVLPSLGEGQYVVLTLTQPVAITADTNYSFRLAFDQSQESNALALYLNPSSSYSSGTAFQMDFSGTGARSNLNGDMAFYLIAIPEPATYSYLAFGLVGLSLLGRVRRSRLFIR